MKTVFVILVHYNNIEITWNCIKSLFESDNTNFNIIVIDNSLKNNDSIYISNNCDLLNHNFNMIKSPFIDEVYNKKLYWYLSIKNLGYAGGINLGFDLVKKSKPEYLLFLNNDTIIPENFLEIMHNGIKKISENDNFGMASPVILTHPAKKIWYYGGYLNLNRCMGIHFQKIKKTEDVFETSFISGCCQLCPSKVYEHLSGMNDKYFLYFEDFDFCYRLIKKGYKLFVIPDAKISHNVGSSTGGSESPLTVFYSTRNRLWFMRDNFSGFKLLNFYFFFIPSRIIKCFIWILSGKFNLINPLFDGIKEGSKKTSIKF